MCSVYTEYAQRAPPLQMPRSLIHFLLIWVPYMGIKFNRKKYRLTESFLDVVSHIPHMLIYGWMIDMYM